MSWWKELSLVLIVGCLAVLASDSGKTSSDTPRIIGDDQDVRLLINPFAFLHTTTTTTKPTRKPAIIVRPSYHYPRYPSYPYYPYDDYYLHRPQPSYPAKKPGAKPAQPSSPSNPAQPKPAKKPVRPIYPSYPSYPAHPPIYPYYPPGHRPPFGFYPPWTYPQSASGQRPYIVVIHPPIPKPVVPKLPEVPKKPETANRNHIVSNFEYPYTQDDGDYEDFEAPDEVVEEQQVENNNEDELMARNIKLDGVSINADSDEDSDTITVDTNDIKLPFGLQLASQPVTGRKVKDQEALIYLRNIKKGRQLKEDETA